MNAKIFTQMCLVMKEIEAIEKDRRNTQGSGYSFRGIDDAYNTLHPLLAKHDIFMIPIVLGSKREERPTKSGGLSIYTILSVKYLYYTTDGSSVESLVEGEAFDTGDKSTSKAMSVAQKYSLLQTFLIPTKESKDPEDETVEFANNHGPGRITIEERDMLAKNTPKLKMEIPKTFIDPKTFLVPFGKDKGIPVANLPKESLLRSLDWCENKAKKPLGQSIVDFVIAIRAQLDILDKSVGNDNPPSYITEDIPF